ncbi:DUF397 domain-containing protein [Marinitenerispora sediminis]|uniref:DUF397 domain-containing protein n=1 Tax=Marinitenerispora sediminis TaxID=1931232 RepID=A0A368T5Q8_9ACTN|nr:DUF397 domain-containing protein [Marinitenerispora sediminis]RCV54519.1 DUF397 domain-containing protein [Marinitenerispora sediminis]RCV58716.1 DUF397 domain-containing protein [Marinitenerispora sediminis]RCV61383.1 DUF397 domain-containing protein [Marinitenerispora sediminis]
MSTDQTAPRDGTEHLRRGDAAPSKTESGDDAPLSWRKSSYSGGQDGQCAEVAMIPGGAVALRDSKPPASEVIRLSGTAWGAFVAALKRDGFD